MSSALPSGITLGTGNGGLPVVDVATSLATARIYLYGAHITHWAPAGEEPVLWLSPDSFFEEGSPIRGGTPLCLPWFSSGPEGDKEPMHGVARLTEWDLVSATEEEGEVTLELQLRMEEWASTITFRIGTTLGISLTTTIVGDADFEVEEALHTYFSVSDVATVTVSGLDGASYFDKVLGTDATQVGDLHFTDRTDRVYAAAGPIEITDPSKGRRIQITNAGAANTVVWNPWADTAAGIADIPDAAWPEFVCVETANVGSFAAVLSPGASRTIATEYRVIRD